MHLVKHLVNVCMRIINCALPETKATFPQSRMLDDVFEEFFRVFRAETYCGLFDDVPRQRVKGLRDRNFLTFLRTTRKILLYLSEHDRYYRQWLGLSFILADWRYRQLLGETQSEETLRSILEQWEIPLQKVVSNQYFESHRKEFVDIMLAYYLPNLCMKNVKRGEKQS